MPATLPALRLDRLTLLEGRRPRLPEGRVQTLRGLACLLLVAFHAVGSSSASGLQVPDGSPYREFTNLFVHIRMPLFTFLSGLVYAYRPLEPGEALRFLGKKLRRLGVPLIVASSILYGLHLAMHDPVAPLSRMWSVYVHPFYHLWFVQALLPVFAVLVVLESFGALATCGRYLAVLALSLVLYAYGPPALGRPRPAECHIPPAVLPVGRRRPSLSPAPAVPARALRGRRVFRRGAGPPWHHGPHPHARPDRARRDALRLDPPDRPVRRSLWPAFLPRVHLMERIGRPPTPSTSTIPSSSRRCSPPWAR